MNQPVSPALQQVATALGVSPGSFERNNYRSVFDIVRHSRKAFIDSNISWLSLHGGKAWDLAMGQAQNIRRLFRENKLTRHIRGNLSQSVNDRPIGKRGTEENIQGLVQDGPSWQNQFAEQWQAYCQSGSPEAVDSPVSYLTWLYRQALTFEQEIAASSTANQVLTLAERRPDLANLTVDDDTINQQIPTLQLVNEILESSIASSLTPEQSVDETLAQTRYPTLLPYHFPHDQVKLALENAGVPLEDIMGQTATDWPWFLNDSWRGGRSDNSTELAAMLAPEQQALVTEPDNSTAADLTAFYQTNLGVETADYTPFEDMDTFTYQLGITVPQVEQLIAGNVGGTSVTLSDNCRVGFTLSTEEAITSASLDSGSRPLPLTLSQNGLSVIRGKFSNGIRCDAFQQAEMYIHDNISSDGTNLKPFTLSFWCKIPAGVPDMAIILTNKTDEDVVSSKGISLFARHTGDTYQLELTASNGSSDPLSTTANFTPDAWIYIVIEIDASSDLYLINSNDGKILNYLEVLHVSQLGSINMTEECWGFNGNKDNNYYKSYPERRVNIEYDDIALWDYGITATALQSYISTGEPAGTVSDVVHYYDFDNIKSNGVGSQSQYGAAFINDDAEPAISSLVSSLQNLSNARMDRINRMVRLQRWLGLSFEETDLLLCACIRAQGANNTDYTLNVHTLRALGVFRHWQQKYGINAFQFAAVLDEITPYAISPAVPFFDQVFNAPSLFDAPFAITGETVSYTDITGDSARIVRQLCAGLDITEAQFRVLADKVAARQGSADNHTFPLMLPVVSALYRLVMVPRWLGLSFADGAALLSLAGEGDAAWAVLADVPQLATLANGQPDGGDILDLLMALEAAAAWAREHHLSWVKNYLALMPEAEALMATAATVNFVNGIKQQLPAALLSEQSFVSVPLPANTTADSWLAVLSDLTDGQGLVLPAARDYDTITVMVSADLENAGITFASEAEQAQAMNSLAGIVNQARQTQSGIADSALAQMFSTAQSLSPFLMQWAGDSKYRLLSESLTMNSGAALTDPSQVPATYITDLFALGQRAGISRAFNLTPAALSIFLAHPDWFGVSDTALTLPLLYRLSRYADWLTVTGDEDRVLAYLSWVNGVTPPDAEAAAGALALLLDWERSEVAYATASLPGELVKTVADVDYVLRLKSLSAETGLSVTPLLATGGLAPGGVTETWDAWQSAGESLVAAQSGQQ